MLEKVGDEKMKYDRIVEIRKQKSQEKVQLAKKEVRRMLGCQERITVTALVRQTGLSEGFFYKNIEIRKIVEDAIRRQNTVCNTLERISDIALEEENMNLRMSIRVLELKVKQLERQNKDLMEENKLLKTMLV